MPGGRDSWQALAVDELGLAEAESSRWWAGYLQIYRYGGHERRAAAAAGGDARRVRSLVERFDIEPSSDFSVK